MGGQLQVEGVLVARAWQVLAACSLDSMLLPYLNATVPLNWHNTCKHLVFRRNCTWTLSGTNAASLAHAEAAPGRTWLSQAPLPEGPPPATFSRDSHGATSKANNEGIGQNSSGSRLSTRTALCRRPPIDTTQHSCPVTPVSATVPR